MIEEKKQKHYLIYQITNLANGKIYIGKHETFNIEDNYFGSGSLIVAAIKKYGIENFEFKILIDLKNKEEMNLLEKMVVTEEFCKREDVYNIKIGGEGGWDYINSNEFLKTKITSLGGYATRDKIRSLPKEVQMEFWKKLSNKIQFARSNWSEEYKDDICSRISNTLKDFYQSNKNPMLGKHHTPETRKKMSENHKGRNNSQYGKMWICSDLTRESRSILKTDPIPDGWRKGRICK